MYIITYYDYIYNIYIYYIYYMYYMYYYIYIKHCIHISYYKSIIKHHISYFLAAYSRS